MPPGARMSYLENGVIKVGVDLTHGGAIVFLARVGGANLINNFDLGRQVQLAFYSGPVPFSAEGQQPAKHWEHIGWNPIQTGDDFRNASKVLEHENDGRTLHVRCRPLQWPLNNVAGECTFDSWLELEGSVVKVRARLNNARSDRTQYPARLQELPAVYGNAAFPRVVSYTGDRPFTGGAVSVQPKSATKHPWTFWQGTEGWSALLDASDEGLGLVTPGRIFFTGGFAGKPGPNDTFGNSTGYLAGQGSEILDHNIGYEFRYELVVGKLEEIRQRAATYRPAARPSWVFAQDRQGWHYRHARDAGWPIAGELQVSLEEPHPQLVSPFTFWQAEEAPLVIIDAAFQTVAKTARLYWQRHGEPAPKATDNVGFPIEGDGTFRRYVVDLSAAPGYRGGIIQLRFDPVPNGAPGEWVKVKSIRFSDRAGADSR